MAFQLRNWSLISGSASQPLRLLQDGSYAGAPSHWAYFSNADELLTIYAPGYFNSQSVTVSVGDCIYAVGTDGSQMYFISKISPVTLVAMTGGGGKTFNWYDAPNDLVMLHNSGYFASGLTRVDLTLPSTLHFGDVFKIADSSGHGWSIVQQAGQQIEIGAHTTNAGAAGGLSSLAAGDCVEIVVKDPNPINSILIVTSSVGNLTYA